MNNILGHEVEFGANVWSSFQKCKRTCDIVNYFLFVAAFIQFAGAQVNNSFAG
jgi:hypothetical protein